MTERKPPGTSWETWTEAQIRAAMKEGAFDNLPAAGKPLPNLNQAHDPLWWVKQFAQREQISMLPPSLEHSWPRALGTSFWYVLVASPAASCSLVDAEAAILGSIAESRLYWIGTALLVAAILVLDLLEKRRSLDFAFGMAVVAFHPAWTVSPFFHADCSFDNVNFSQWAAVLLTSTLITRVLRLHRRRKLMPAIGASQ